MADLLMKPNHLLENPSKWLESLIKSFVAESPENSLKNETNDKAWEEPLVGFSAANDPLYQFFKTDIGEFYWTPLEIFLKTFHASEVTADQLTVISWVLPQTEATKADNRKQIRYPSERWARSRTQGEEVNDKLRRFVVSSLQEMGFKAIAPMLSPLWERITSGKYNLASTWSERHAAYASGLGTFGLCDGLITARGKAMRCGSVITDVKVEPTRRPYNNHQAYCLYFSKRLCGKCIQRCPARAISTSGHDKSRCRNYIHNVVETFVQSHYGFKSYGCGLCQTGVPCESKIPTEHDL